MDESGQYTETPEEETKPELTEAESEELEEALSYVFVAVGAVLVAGAVTAGFVGEILAAFVVAVLAAGALGFGVPSLVWSRRKRLSSSRHEKELLAAIQDYSGQIAPAEAAMKTSLTVEEADRMLSGMAASGYLAVETRDGALIYALPSSREEKPLEG